MKTEIITCVHYLWTSRPFSFPDSRDLFEVVIIITCARGHLPSGHYHLRSLSLHLQALLILCGHYYLRPGTPTQWSLLLTFIISDLQDPSPSQILGTSSRLSGGPSLAERERPQGGSPRVREDPLGTPPSLSAKKVLREPREGPENLGRRRVLEVRDNERK